MTNTSEMGRMTTVTPVMTVLIDSIITTTPTRVVTEVMSWVTDWLRLCPSVSISFVMRESTSPTVRDSKYFIGMRWIFSEISRRMR